MCVWVSHMGIGFLHDLNFPEVKRERKGRLLFTCPGVGALKAPPPPACERPPWL